MNKDVRLAEKYISKAKNAERRGIEFDLSLLSYRNMNRAKKCFYSGVKLTECTAEGQPWNGRTIDRVDNRQGYVKGNVVACSVAANQLKEMVESKRFGLTLDEMIKVLKKCKELGVVAGAKQVELLKFTNQERSTPVGLEDILLDTPDNPTFKDKTGVKHGGKFTVVGYLGTGGTWVTQCECGQVRRVSTIAINNNNRLICSKCG